VDNLPDRINTLLMRINTIELQVQQLQQQLQQVPAQYVPASVNELHLQSLRLTADRIETDVKDLKTQFVDLGDRLDTQIVSQQQAHDNFQIRILWGIISLVIAVGVGLLIAYLTHALFH
jgi:chaperonin cofactor prefoldin